MFYVALIALFLLVALIVANCLFIHRSVGYCEKLLREMEEKEDREQKYHDLLDYWDHRERLISFSVYRTVIDAMRACLLNMEAALKTGDDFSFESARLLAIETLSEIKTLEEWEIDNII